MRTRRAMSTSNVVAAAGYLAAGCAVGLFATFIIRTGTKVLSNLESSTDAAPEEGNVNR